MQDRKPVLIETLLDVFPAFLAFMVPIFFLPITSEFFEFNKLALVTVSTVVMLAVWLAKMLINRKVEVTKSPVDITFIVFLLVTVLATVFSLHKVSSLFGSQGRWFPSLFSTVVLGVFYYTTASNLSAAKAIRTVVYGLIGGTTLSSLIALLGYVGLKFGGASFLQIPNFTTTGSTETVAILAAVGIVLSLSRVIAQEKSGLKTAFLVGSIVNFLTVLLVGSLASWVTLGAGLLTLAYMSKPEDYTSNKTLLSIFMGFAIFVIALLIVPVTRNVFVNKNYPSEIKISPRESWIVTSSVIRDFPILGTGPSTFPINYNRYKPVSVNDQSYWGIRFDKPFSEAFSLITSMGIVGLIAGLALTFKVIKYSLDAKRSVEDKEIATGLGAAAVAITVTFGVTFATVATGFTLMLLLAALAAKYRLEGINGTENVNLSLSSMSKGNKMSLISTEKEVFQYIMAVPMVLAALAGSYYMVRQYMGEVYTRNAIAAAQANNGSLTYQMQQKAIQAFPVRDSYHNSYANTNIALANALASKEKLNDDEKKTVQALIAQAIRSSRVTTEVLNPLNAANWETRAVIYRALLGVAKDANEWAVRSLNAAIQLDPANPRLRLALGGVYYAQNDYLSAANLFSQAISLKRDYANAHYNLAQSLKQLKKYPEAIKELEATQKLIDENSEDGKKVAAEISELSKMPNVAGATSDKPSVADIEGKDQTKPAAPKAQEPLTNEGNAKTLEGTGLNLNKTGEAQTQPANTQPTTGQPTTGQPTTNKQPAPVTNTTPTQPKTN